MLKILFISGSVLDWWSWTMRGKPNVKVSLELQSQQADMDDCSAAAGSGAPGNSKGSTILCMVLWILITSRWELIFETVLASWLQSKLSPALLPTA